VLLSAVELGVFSALAEGPLDLDALGERVGVHPRGRRDFFDALVAMGLLERSDGKYANTPETERFLDPAKDTYIGGWLEMGGVRIYPMWAGLTDALRSGRPVSEPPAGVDHFAALYRDPARMRLYVRSMTGLSLATNRAIARRFPWSRYRTFADLGTAEGDLPVAVASAHPHLSGVGLDLPPVEPLFTEHVAKFGLAGRVRFQAGDFTTDPLPRADVLVMGHILHNFGLEQKRELIARAYEALQPGGALLVYEALIDDARRTNVFGLLLSLHMLVATRAGFDYTGADCGRWLAEAGFRDVYVEPLGGPDSMVVGFKEG
jgi:ubiquinone/menaquinone biosynthesis C-methylase UbiE